MTLFRRGRGSRRWESSSWLVLPKASKRTREDTSFSVPIGRHSPQPQRDSLFSACGTSASEFVSKSSSGSPTYTSRNLWPSPSHPTIYEVAIPSGCKLPFESLFREQSTAMVIFGGLELVAAGVILHKYNKGKEQERDLERDQERRARERRHDRKHHHRRDSPPQHIRKDQSLYPPKGQIPRPQSAPPPGYAPNWQHQPIYYPPQPWQPQQDEKTPAWQPQPQPNYYPPPTWQAQAPPQPHSRQEPQPNTYPRTLHDDAALSELLQGGSPNYTRQAGSRTQPRPTAIPPPDPNYAELSADPPGAYAAQAHTSPHVSFALPRDELHDGAQRDPPPAYQPYVSEQRE